MKTIAIIILLLFVICLIGYGVKQQEEIKNKNGIIEIDNQIIEKHERELELYGDFFIAIIKGDDRDERLMRKETLEAGAKMTEIKKEIEDLLRKRGDLK